MDQHTEVCMICLDLLKTKMCTKLECCGKVIHDDCIFKWVVQKNSCTNTCPNCRTILKAFHDFVNLEDKNVVDFVDLVDE